MSGIEPEEDEFLEIIFDLEQDHDFFDIVRAVCCAATIVIGVMFKMQVEYASIAPFCGLLRPDKEKGLAFTENPSQSNGKVNFTVSGPYRPMYVGISTMDEYTVEETPNFCLENWFESRFDRSEFGEVENNRFLQSRDIDVSFEHAYPEPHDLDRRMDAQMKKLNEVWDYKYEDWKMEAYDYIDILMPKDNQVVFEVAKLLLEHWELSGPQAQGLKGLIKSTLSGAEEDSIS